MQKLMGLASIISVIVAGIWLLSKMIDPETRRNLRTLGAFLALLLAFLFVMAAVCQLASKK